MAPFLDRLREALPEEEFRLLMEATDDGRLLPFGPEAVDEEEVLLMDADDDVLDLLAQCSAIIGEEATATRSGLPALPTERLCFTFSEGGPELDHFLGSLQRNGFTATTLESGEFYVFVYLESLSDHDFFTHKETLKSLYELSSVAKGKMPKGRRLE